ncbi:MAG TPA: sugar phosphate nucleotidyltransferase [Patescibacteria group bacterium]
MKTRLTITLSDSTLAKVDQLIDKKKIRNRSHAIEHLLEKTLEPTVSTAVILAGGPIHDTFRPLTLLDNRPLILYILDHLQRFGVTNIVIATNAQGSELESILETHHSHATLVYEPEPLGTAGALKHIEKYLEGDRFFVIPGDVLTDINLHDLTEFHTAHNTVATMAVKPRISKATYDNVFIQGNVIVDFQKSTPDQTVSIVNTGVYLFEKKILDLIPDGPSMLERDIFPTLSKTHRLMAFPFQGIWFDITSDTNYQEALTKINNRSAK